MLILFSLVGGVLFGYFVLGHTRGGKVEGMLSWKRRPLIVGLSGGLLFAAVAMAVVQVPTGNIVIFLLYFLPVFVAALRSKAHPGGVVVVDLLLGWTVIGWIVALAMAASGSTTKDVVPARVAPVVPVTGPPVVASSAAATAPALLPLRTNANSRWGLIIAGVLVLTILWLGSVIANSPSTSTPRVVAATIAPGVPVATVAVVAPASTAAPVAPHIGSVVRGGNWQYEVLKVDTAKTLRTGPYDFEVLTPKGMWIVVAFNLTNVGSRNFTLNDWDVELLDSKGITYDPNYESSSFSHSLNRAALGEQMPPGVTVMVTLIFDVAPGTTGMRLHPVQGGPDIRLE
jgi:hypothetical protein